MSLFKPTALPESPTQDPTNPLFVKKNIPNDPNPVGGIRATSQSKYLDGLTQYNKDIQGVKAANQGFWDELGNGLAQSGSEMVLGAVEGVGYLGVGKVVDHLRGTEQDFGNSLSTWAGEVNDKFKQEVVPVYNSEQYGNWHEWLFTHLPSIASAISLMVPAMAGSKLLGATARTLGGNMLMKTAGIMKGSQGRALLDATFDTFSMAAMSRHAENMMESAEVYNTIYEEALTKGFSEQHAKTAAKEGAELSYEKNWNLIGVDLLQYGLLLRTFKGASRATSGALKQAATKNIGRDLGIQMVTEGGEEGYQFVTGQEAARTAKLKYGIDEEDYTRFGDRMLNYLSDPDFWTSVTMGALGGAVFEAAGPAIGKGIDKLSGVTPAIEQQRTIANDYETYLAGLAKDPIAFKNAKDKMVSEVILKGIMSGNADQAENFFKLIKENAPNDQRLSEEERGELLEMANTSLADLQKYETQFNEFNKLNSPDNAKFLLLNRLSHDLSAKTSNRFGQQALKHLTEISQNNSFNALETQLIEQEIQLLLLEELQQSKKEDFSAEIFTQKITETKAKIKEYKDALVASGNLNEKQITERLQAPDFSLYSIYKQAEIGHGLVAAEATKQFNQFNTPKGKEKLSKDIEKSREIAKETQFKAIMDTISSNSTMQEVQTARQQADAIGKTTEFNKQFEETIKKQQATSPKFEPTNPIDSLLARWKDNPLLKEYELNKISNLMLMNGGIPSDTVLDEQNIARIYNESNTADTGFSKALRNYFATNSSLSKIEKKDVKEKPISQDQSNPIVDETEGKIIFIEDILSVTGHSNLSTVQQYAFNRQTKEFKKNSEGEFIDNDISIAKKIKDTRGWEYLNAGKIPEGATLELEFDQNDPFNQGKVGGFDQINENNFLIEIAYYDNNNRVVIGAVPMYIESQSYESQEAKRDLKALREQLWKNAKNSSPNQGVISLKATTKFVEYKAGGGRFHNIKGSNTNPISVLLPNEELVLGVSMKATQAGKVFVDFNGHPVQQVVMSKNDLKEGQVYMVIPDLNNAGYRVVKIRAKRLKETPERLDTLTEYVKTMKDSSEIEVTNFIIPTIKSVASIKNINYNNEVFTIELADTTVQAREEDLREVLGNLMAQVDVKKINTTENGVKYNEKLADEGIIVTDLHPTQPYHSTAFTFSKATFKGQPKAEPVKELKSEEKTTTKPSITIPKVDGKTLFGKEGKFKIVEEVDFAPLNEQEITAWFHKNLPQIPVDIIPHLIEIKKNGGQAYGVFKDAVITLYRNAPSSTAYHEAFHAIFNLFLSPQQQEDILNELSIELNIPRSFDKRNDLERFSAVNYTLKSIEILQTPKADEIFRKGDKNNWNIDKILNELQVPKEQQELIKSFNTRNREEILTSLLANYSYTVEINTATATTKERFKRNRLEEYNPELDAQGYDNSIAIPTQHYSNLTVPGGTNYIENEIATPAITPSIKGHAQFATDKGIGWFRSDEQIKDGTINKIKVQSEEPTIMFDNEGNPYQTDRIETRTVGGIPTKTRRILEVQSDLFQKGRDKESLILNEDEATKKKMWEFKTLLKNRIETLNNFKRLHPEQIDEIKKREKEIEGNIAVIDAFEKPNENQFLQLLNKDNNWVTFFIKSIIQDSAKKGYEKILFPTGDTASKVEGHSTLEEFKKQKEDRIKELESLGKLKSKVLFENGNKYFQVVNEKNEVKFGTYTKSEDAFNKIESVNNEINQLKQELERVEREGFAALKPIYNFYENTVTNILNKTYGKENVKLITDEYGNTWNEITLSEKEKQEIIRFSALKDEVYNTNDLKLEEILADRLAAYIESDGKVKKGLGYNTLQFFRKLWETLKAIFSDSITIDNLFFRINTGFYANKAISNRSIDPRYKVSDDPITAKKRAKLVNYLFFETLDLTRQQVLGETNLENTDDLQALENLATFYSEQGTTFTVKDVIIQLYQNSIETLKEANASLPDTDSRKQKLNTIVNEFIETKANGEIDLFGGYLGKAVRELAYYGIVVKDRVVITEANKFDQDEEFTTTDESGVQQGVEVSGEEYYYHIHDETAIERNPKETLSYIVRKALRRTERWVYDKNILNDDGYKGKFIQDERINDDLGFTSYVDFDEIENYLRYQLVDIYTAEDMMVKIAELQYNRPELHGILLRLEQDSRLKSSFFSVFAGTYYPSLQVAVESKKTYSEYESGSQTKISVFNANRKNIRQLLIDTWNDNLKSTTNNTVTKEGSINLAEAKLAYEEFEVVKKAITDKKNIAPEDAIKLEQVLSNFGIEIDAQIFLNEFQERKSYSKGKISKIPAYQNLYNFLFGPNSVTTLLDSILLGNNPYEGERTLTETKAATIVASIAVRNMENFHQDNSLSIDGKVNYAYTLPTFFTKLLVDLKDDVARQEYLNHWWFGKLKWLQDIDGIPALKDRIELGLFNGLKGDGRKNGTKYFKLTDKDLFIADFNLFNYATNTDYAWYRFPTLADSSLAPTIKFKKYSKEEVVDALYQLALAEQERINKVNELGDTLDIKNLKTRGKEYLFMDLFNDGSINISNAPVAKEAIENWMQQNFAEEQTRLKDLGILNAANDFASNKDGSIAIDDFKFKDGAKKRKALEDFYYNKTLANASIIALTSIDLAYYDSNDKFLKRNNQSSKFTQMIDITAQYTDGTTPGSHYKVMYLKDIKGVSEQVTKAVEETLRANNYKEDEIIAILSLYEKTNRTDGQGFITLDEYKKREIGFGAWTDKHEQAYQLAQKGVWDSSVNIFFQPAKPFVFTHEKLDKFVIPVQHKDSEVVLLPAFVKNNPELKKLLDFMQDKENGIDSVLFESAVKVGGYGFATIDNLNDALVHRLSREDWGRQQPVPEHHLDTQNLFGSQIRKIITSGLDESIKVMGMNKEGIFNTYQKLLTDNLIESFNNVSKKLGTIEKVQEILIQEIRNRQLGEAYENAVRIVEYNGEKRFNIPLFDPIHSRKMQNLINAVIRKAVTKQKINGGSFVLAAEVRTSNRLKIVRNADGGIAYFEAMLPAWTKNLLRIENGEVDINSIPNDVLDLFGYRIPTEGLYSAKRIKVVGFTPDYMGGVIILPGEITTIAGEDFDIDKLYVMIPNTRKRYNWKQLRRDFNEQNDFLTWRKLNGYEKNTLKEVINSIEDKVYNESATVEETEFYEKFQEFNKASKEKYYKGVEKVRYNLNDNNLTKRQRDNALMDIMKEIWSHPTSAARIVETGGFPTLTTLAKQMREKFGVNLNANPILPQNDYKFFNRTTNGNNLIGIAAIHNAFHGGISQHTELGINKSITINGKTSKSLSGVKEIGTERYIQKNLQEFIAAFVDNINEPVADDTNINLYTINHAMLLAHNGRDLTTIIQLLNQPIIRELTKRYFNNGATFAGEKEAVKKLLARFKEILGEEQVPKAGVYKLNISDALIGKKLSDLNVTELREQAKILRTWIGLSPYSLSLSAVVKATRVDTSGTGQTMADNGYALKQISRISENTLLTDVGSVLKVPLVDISNTLLARSQNEILSKYFPYNGQLFNTILDKAQILKGNELNQQEVNFLFNNFTHFYASGFNFFENKLKERGQTKQDFVLNFPNRFDKVRKDADFGKYVVMKHLRYIPATPENKLPRVQFSSNTTLSSEQRENLSLSMESMLSSDNQKVQEMAKDLVMYAYFTTYFGYTYTGISHLVPTTYLENISDTNDNSYSNFIYKMMDEKNHWQYANIFLHQLLRHQREDNTLLRTIANWSDQVTGVKKDDRTNVTSILIDATKARTNGLVTYNKEKEQIIVPAFRSKSNSITRVYAYAGRTSDGGFVYNLLSNLGYEKHLLEFDIHRKELESVLPFNNIKVEANKVFNIDPNFAEENLYDGETQAPPHTEEDIYFSDEEPMYALDNEQQYKKADEELNQSLKNWLSSLGFSVEYHETLINRLGVDAKGAALIYQKLVLIAQGKEDITTLPEEVGHVAEAYSRGTNFHNRLMDIVHNTPIYQQVVAEYGEVYGNNDIKLRQEAIGKLIGEAILKQNQEAREQSGNVVIQFLQGLWKRFVSFFKRADVNELQNEVSAIVGNIASDVIDGNTDNFKAVNIKIGDKFYSLNNANLTPEKEALAKALESIFRKLKIYENRSLNTFTASEKKLFDDLEKQFNEKKYQEAIITYVDNAQKELKLIEQRYNKIKDFNTLELASNVADIKENINTLRAAQNYVAGFSEAISDISALDSLPEPVLNKVLQTKRVIELLNKDYIKQGKSLLEKIFKKYSTHPGLNIKAALDLLQEDIGFVNRAFDSLAETKEPILKILDVVVKDALNTYQRKTIEFTKQINDLQNRLQEAGVPSNSFIYERDKAGYPTGNRVSKFNKGSFEQEKSLFFDSIGKRPDNEIEARKWNKKVSDWFRDNQKTREDLATYLKDKEAEFKEIYGDRLGSQKYDKWLGDNTKSYTDPSGETTITYIKELAQPSDNYLSLQYQDIYRKNSDGSYVNQAMVDYYEFAINNLDKQDKNSPQAHKLSGRMPAIRKDFWERAAYVDKDGKKKLRSARDTAKQFRETIADTFLAKEDEIEFGLIDENGSPVNYVPIFFTKSMYGVGYREAKNKGLKGKDAREYARKHVRDNLSLDASSALIAYNNSVNNYHAMTSVIDVAELTKDVIAQRPVFTGKINPVSIYNKLVGNKSGEKGSKITTSGVTSMAYERIDDYIKMVLFGQQKINEEWLKGVGLNTAKTIDFLNTYTSLSSLAVNVYAGTANILFGNAMIRLEGIAGEVINNKEILLGDKIYAESLPGVIEDIGKRNASAYLNLWIEQHNTMQDYNRELYDTDSGRSSRVARLMKMSSLYFINHAGEHYMQTKSSIALAHRSKVMDKEGNIIPYWEAYDKVNIGTAKTPTYALKLKEGLTKVGGSIEAFDSTDGADKFISKLKTKNKRYELIRKGDKIYVRYERDSDLYKFEEHNQSLTETDINRFVNRQNWLNKRLHGVYNNIDKSAIQKYALGRMAMLFRKFIKPGFNRRFEELEYNEEGEIWVEGYYRTFGRISTNMIKSFIGNLRGEMNEANFVAATKWDDLKDFEKANMLRTIGEISFMLATAVLASALTQLADDDEDNWLIAFMAYEAHRVHSELNFYINPQEGLRIMKSPAAAVYQIERAQRLLYFWDWFTEYETGKNKGLNRLEVGVIETMPFAKTFRNFRTPDEQLKFFSNNPAIMVGAVNKTIE